MFTNSYIKRIYNYIRCHDGDIILMYEMEKDLMITQPTLRKHLKWLEERDLIKRVKKRFWIIPI